MSDNLLHIVLVIVASIGALAGLLVMMTFLEPSKDLHSPPRYRR